MGRPFASELKLIPNTIKWAVGLDVTKIAEMISRFYHPVYIVGSGGSFSACAFAADLLTSVGVFAKPVTPLELFYSRGTTKKSNIIFISASGSNTDILFAYKKAIESEPISVINICMRKGSKLSKLASDYSGCSSFEFEPPAGKDGFLATSSLIAYFIILYRAIIKKEIKFGTIKTPAKAIKEFIRTTNDNTCFSILFGSYNRAVAVDIESKLSEAGLAPSLLSDYRHFAHGRHQWFDKQKDSAVIALRCEEDKQLCDKTLQLLPSSIPKLIFDTDKDKFLGTIYLLVQSMHFINGFGVKKGIDPGRPGVPDYGSKIYHLKYERLVSDNKPSIIDLSIIRKAKVDRIEEIKADDYKKWKMNLSSFDKKMVGARFGGLVFDYDGTLCSPANRFTGIGEKIKQLLVNFLRRGFVLGIISGRGQSLRVDLERAFAEKPDLMKNVIVGYYNGSDIAPLTDSSHPVKASVKNRDLEKIVTHLKSIGIKAEESPNQLTFTSKTTKDWIALKEMLLNEIMLLNMKDITMVESSHSLDIISRDVASKNNILHHCTEICRKNGLSTEVICIGDKGQWPGNDYALLANEYSLSVGDVSSIPQTGWNVCPVGLRDEKAVEYLFSKLNYSKNHFSIKTLVK